MGKYTLLLTYFLFKIKIHWCLIMKTNCTIIHLFLKNKNWLRFALEINLKLKQFQVSGNTRNYFLPEIYFVLLLCFTFWWSIYIICIYFSFSFSFVVFYFIFCKNLLIILGYGIPYCIQFLLLLICLACYLFLLWVQVFYV